VTNNNEFWIGWLDLLALLYNYNQLYQLTHWTPSARHLSDECRLEILLLLSEWRTDLCYWMSLSHVTTDGQSVTLSWNKAPIWGLRPDFIAVRNTEYVGQLRVCWHGALSLTRGRVCRLQLLLALASAVILGSVSLGTRDHIYCLSCWMLLYNHFARITQKTASIVKEVCLLICCLVMDVLLLRAFVSAGMCLPNCCLTMGLHLNIIIDVRELNCGDANWI
jgi:hypothetical protein